MARFHTPTLRYRLLALTLGLLAVLPLAELCSRVYYSARYQDLSYARYPWTTPVALSGLRIEGPQGERAGSDGQGRAWKLTPGAHRVQTGPLIDHDIIINDSGYRGPDFEEPRTARWRVAAIGGSSTFSGECSMGTAYPAVLEELWNERYGTGSVEVVNRGLPGAGLGDLLTTVEQDILPNDPDLITVYSAFNSLRQSTATVDLRQGTAPWHRRMLFGRSLYYTVLAINFARRENDHVVAEAGGRKRDQAAKRYREDLKRVVEMSRDAGVAVLFIQQAMLEPSLARRGHR